MKTKNLNKKLVLNKITLTNLEQQEMRNFKGGEITGGTTRDKLCYITSCVTCTELPQLCEPTLWGC